MAIYIADWSEFSVTGSGQTWARRWWATAGISFDVIEEPLAPDGLALRITNSNNGNRAISLLEAADDPDRDQFDLIALLRVNNTPGATVVTYGGLVALGSGGTSTANGTTAMLASLNAQTRQLRRRNIVSGAATITAEPFTWSPGDLYWLRLTRDGGNAVARTYAYETPKGTPLSEVSQPIATEGALDWFGLCVFQANAEVEYLWFGAGTGEDEAPIPDGWGEAPGLPVLSAPALINLGGFRATPKVTVGYE